MEPTKDHGQMPLFSKFMKKINRISNDQCQQPSSNMQNRRGNNFWRRNRYGVNGHDNHGVKSKGIQCRKCERFGHIHTECFNIMKKNNKSYVVKWSDDDSDNNKQNEENTNFLAFNIVTYSKDEDTGGSSSGNKFAEQFPDD